MGSPTCAVTRVSTVSNGASPMLSWVLWPPWSALHTANSSGSGLATDYWSALSDLSATPFTFVSGSSATLWAIEAALAGSRIRAAHTNSISWYEVYRGDPIALLLSRGVGATGRKLATAVSNRRLSCIRSCLSLWMVDSDSELGFSDLVSACGRTVVVWRLQSTMVGVRI